MKTFIYVLLNKSTKRGYNRTITVYRVKNNTPEFVGTDDRIITGCYKGDYATACHIIADATGAKMAASGYALESKNVRVLPL